MSGFVVWTGLRCVMSEVTTDVEVEHATVKTFPNLFLTIVSTLFLAAANVLSKISIRQMI